MRKNSYIDEKRKADARVDWAVKNKINYFQPTISPAPKNSSKREIESLEEAMKYYQPYSNKLVLQTKYMGSYCCMYLNKDHSKSYFVSRNGYMINHVEGLHKASKYLQEKLFWDDRIEWVLVESELMPWRVMGSGLIDKEYGNYGYLHSSHLTYLQGSSVVDKIQKLRETSPWNREELRQHEVRQYASLKDLNIRNMEDYKNSINLYLEQLSIFGTEAETEFKPFNILKTIFEDGSEILPEEHIFLGKEDDCLIIDSDDYQAAYEFFEKHKDLKHEGIMVKPLRQQLINITPCLKVRTNSYLQLIYGVNFNRDFDYYMEKRNVRYKLMQSVSDYETAVQLIRTPYNKIESSPRYRDLFYKAIDGEQFTKTLDTRL